MSVSFVKKQNPLSTSKTVVKQIIPPGEAKIIASGLHDLLHKKFLIEGSSQIQFIPLIEIIYLRASKNYTEFICTNNKSYISTNTLKHQEEKLPGDLFIRAHHGFLLNLFHLNHIKKNNELTACMSNGENIPISTRKKKQVLEFINNSIMVLDKTLIQQNHAVNQ